MHISQREVIRTKFRSGKQRRGVQNQDASRFARPRIMIVRSFGLVSAGYIDVRAILGEAVVHALPGMNSKKVILAVKGQYMVRSR